MKQVHASYSFVASTKTITLTGLNIDQDQLLLIVNASRGVQYFNFADSSLRATVTAGANTTVVLTDASTTGHANGDALVIYYDDQVTSQVVSGTVTANPGTGAFTVSGTVGLDNASLVALENVTVTVGSSVSISNFPSTQTVAGTVTANVAGQYFDFTSGDTAQLVNPVYYDGEIVRVTPNLPLPVTLRPAPYGQTTITVSGAVTVGNSVTIGSLPAISGTVTVGASSVTFNAYIGQRGDGSWQPISLESGSNHVNANVQNSVTIGSLPAISGTVTANVVGWDGGNQQNLRIGGYSVGEGDSGRLALEVVGVDGNPLPISGTVTVGNSVTIGSLPAISGTVTANNPSGALTTRFGSVTTANTAQITSAVTNTSRKYLLAQNISAGTVTIGIGFSPTTTQGIQLTAGGGLTFDAFCPTGAVYWLGAVTGAAYTILEG